MACVAVRFSYTACVAVSFIVFFDVCSKLAFTACAALKAFRLRSYFSWRVSRHVALQVFMAFGAFPVRLLVERAKCFCLFLTSAKFLFSQHTCYRHRTFPQQSCSSFEFLICLVNFAFQCKMQISWIVRNCRKISIDLLHLHGKRRDTRYIYRAKTSHPKDP